MSRLRSVRFILFAATGLAVPFYAFFPFRISGRAIDAATVLAVLFVAAGAVAALRGTHPARAEALFLLAALAVPLAVLLPPQPERFDSSAFGVSFCHWALLVLFFVFGLSLDLSEVEKRRLARLNLALGTLIAAFALYQAVGIPRGWPATGPWLVPFQREPLRLSPSGPGGGYIRPTSVFLEPAWMGGYLAWVLLLGAGLWRSEARAPGRRAQVGAALGLIFLALAASVSWGAYADAAIAGLVLLSSLRRSFGVLRRALYAALAVAALGALLLATPPGRTVGHALSNRWRMLRSTPLDGPGSSPQVRDSSWIRVRNAAYTLELWKRHPLKGIGLGQFRRHAPPRDGPKLTQEWVAQSEPWCGWLTAGAEMGPAGPALLLAAILLVLSRWKGRRDAPFAWLVPALAALAVTQQLHTGSYIDLWWWFPLTLAGALTGAAPGLGERPSPRSDPQM